MTDVTDRVDAYLAELSDERREQVEVVRQVVLGNLPEGYVEAFEWGMISYQVPLARYPDTYNKKPLMYAALASQKRYMSLYLTGIYIDEDAATRFERDYRATGKRFDAGKSCVRFRKLEDLPLEIVGEAIAAMSVEDFIAAFEKARGGR